MSNERMVYKALADCRKVLYYLRRLLGNPEDAADCFQESLLALFDYPEPTKVDDICAFLSRVARNKAMDLIRKRTRDREFVDKQPDYASKYYDRQNASWLSLYEMDVPNYEACVGDQWHGLEDKERNLLLLRHCQGMTLENIGLKLGNSTTTAQRNLLSAQQRFRYLLQVNCESNLAPIQKRQKQVEFLMDSVICPAQSETEGSAAQSGCDCG